MTTASQLAEGEADTVVIAGMGGGLVIHILTEGAKVLKSVETLVLQPQSEFARVRDYLEKNEYRIEEEHMLCEDGKYYAMMRVKHGKMNAAYGNRAEIRPRAPGRKRIRF